MERKRDGEISYSLDKITLSLYHPVSQSPYQVFIQTDLAVTAQTRRLARPSEND